MTLGVLLALVGAGLLIGFTAGLVGIGGGVLIVPLLYFVYGHGGWSGFALDPSLHAVVAHATSLFVIVPTSALGAWTYHRDGIVDWRAALPIAGFSVAGAVAGSLLGPRVPAGLLKLGFGLVLLMAAARLLRSPTARPSGRPHLFAGAVGGLAVGLLAALLGVGGGIVAIPILVYLMHLEMERVAATSLAIIAFTATTAAVGYALAGSAVAGLPAGSVGYVHVLAGLPILLGALLAVSSGARLNQRLQARALRRVFALLFIVLGVRLVLVHGLALTGLG